MYNAKIMVRIVLLANRETEESLTAEHLVLRFHLDVEFKSDDKVPSLHEFLELLPAKSPISEGLHFVLFALDRKGPNCRGSES